MIPSILASVLGLSLLSDKERSGKELQNLVKSCENLNNHQLLFEELGEEFVLDRINQLLEWSRSRFPTADGLEWVRRTPHVQAYIDTYNKNSHVTIEDFPNIIVTPYAVLLRHKFHCEVIRENIVQAWWAPGFQPQPIVTAFVLCDVDGAILKSKICQIGDPTPSLDELINFFKDKIPEENPSADPEEGDFGDWYIDVFPEIPEWVLSRPYSPGPDADGDIGVMASTAVVTNLGQLGYWPSKQIHAHLVIPSFISIRQYSAKGILRGKYGSWMNILLQETLVSNNVKPEESTEEEDRDAAEQLAGFYYYDERMSDVDEYMETGPYLTLEKAIEEARSSL
jgi:hypothetical protein